VAEGLQQPDGTPVDADKVNRQFAESMAAPPADDIPAPPRREPEQPSERPKRPRSPRARAAASKPSGRATGAALDKQRREGVRGLVQVAAGGCLVMDQRTAGDAYRADALTLASNADELADACVATAAASDSFGRVLDRVTSAGPYAALITVSVSVGAQIARNHGVKSAEMMGAVPPETLLKADGEQAA
jgi:hypothetical protein